MSEREKALEAALLRWQSYGCPDCSGDCGSANPPVFCCIMQETRAALAMPSTVDGADFLRGWEAGRDAAASWHDERIAILDEQIAENNAYAERTGAAVWEANKYCGDLKSAHRLAACSIRNLTPPEEAP
jgi:hypothetical protein